MNWIISVLTIAYAIGGIVTIICLFSGTLTMLKAKTVRVHLISDVLACVFVFVASFGIWSQWDYMKNGIPDGTYQANVEVTEKWTGTSYYLPADLKVQTIEDYEDSSYYLGAAEMYSSRIAISKQYTLDAIYFGNDEMNTHGNEVYPEQDVELWLDEGEFYVNIGVMSAQALGVTPADNWSAQSIFGKVEAILVPVSSIVLVLHYFFLDPEKTDRRSKQK